MLAINAQKDTSIAMVKDEVLYLIEYDRLTKVKHYGEDEWQTKLLSHVDRVLKDPWHNRIYKLFTLAKELFGQLPKTIGATSIDVNEYRPDGVNPYKPPELTDKGLKFIEKVVGHPLEIKCLDHAVNHALEAAWTNNLKEGIVVELDGVGDGCGAAFKLKNDKLTELHRRRKVSFGELYKYLATYFIPEVPDNSADGVYMAYAGLGTRVNLDAKWRKMLRQFGNGQEFPWQGEPGRSLVFNLLEEWCAEYKKEDVAYTVQQLWTEDVLEYLYKFADKKAVLAFTGGCAFNCGVNRRLVEDSKFKDVVWTPMPGDMGQPIGVLLQAGYSFKSIKTPKPYDLEWWLTKKSKELKARRYSLEELARRLKNGEIIGVIRGEVERGPRALGYRSILASPLTKGIVKRLNNVKQRQWYRPFGVVINLENLNEFTDLKLKAPWMNVTITGGGQLREVTHADGTVRVQTVMATQDQWLHTLIKEFQAITGVPALINTSLNGPGKPIANYVEDALAIKGLNALVVNDLLVDL